MFENHLVVISFGGERNVYPSSRRTRFVGKNDETFVVKNRPNYGVSSVLFIVQNRPRIHHSEA